MSREFMYSPRLTILMPAYNAAPYINEAIDSLLQQTFTDFELWIVDDASTDSTPQLLSSYTDSRMKIFTNTENKGRDSIVNSFAIKFTTAFFTITDADDISHPTRLQKQINLLNNDPTIMMCGTSYSAVDIRGYLVRSIILLSDYSAVLKKLEKHSQFHGPTTLMRKQVLTYFPILYRSGYFEADADLSCRIAERFKSVNCTEPLYYYRIVPNSMSRQRVTAFSINSYRVIYEMHVQRMQHGKDFIERKDFTGLEKYKNEWEHQYDPSSLQLHLAFDHAYWGLFAIAKEHVWKAFILKPFRIKNSLSLVYIILRSGLFYLNQALNKTHYSSLLTRTP